MDKTEKFHHDLESISDEKLIELCHNEITQLCESGSKSFTMSIPPRIHDTDILLSEMIRRFKLKTENILTRTLTDDERELILSKLFGFSFDERNNLIDEEGNDFYSKSLNRRFRFNTLDNVFAYTANRANNQGFDRAMEIKANKPSHQQYHQGHQQSNSVLIDAYRKQLIDSFDVKTLSPIEHFGKPEWMSNGLLSESFKGHPEHHSFPSGAQTSYVEQRLIQAMLDHQDKKYNIVNELIKRTGRDQGLLINESFERRHFKDEGREVWLIVRTALDPLKIITFIEEEPTFNSSDQTYLFTTKYIEHV